MNEAKVKYEELTAYTIKILEKLGYPKAQADVTAWVLVEADARGVNSHGVGRLEFYESNIKNGFNIPAAEPEIVHETPLSMVVDGRHGVGAYVAQFTMNRVLEKAKERRGWLRCGPQLQPFRYGGSLGRDGDGEGLHRHVLLQYPHLLDRHVRQGPHPGNKPSLLRHPFIRQSPVCAGYGDDDRRPR